MSDTTENGLRKLVFGETKPLPSYLVAFAVGPWEFVDAGTAGKNHVPVRIVTPKGRSAEAKYAAEVTATILTRLEDYFGIPYPYEKSDQVAVPVTLGIRRYGKRRDGDLRTDDATGQLRHGHCAPPARVRLRRCP